MFIFELESYFNAIMVFLMLIPIKMKILWDDKFFRPSCGQKLVKNRYWKIFINCQKIYLRNFLTLIPIKIMNVFCDQFWVIYWPFLILNGAKLGKNLPDKMFVKFIVSSVKSTWVTQKSDSNSKSEISTISEFYRKPPVKITQIQFLSPILMLP